MALINELFTERTMLPMHESLLRLLEHARKVTADQAAPVRDLADLKQQMGASSQKFHNWTKRGISKDGALDAERLFGIPASELVVEADSPLFPGERVLVVHERSKFRYRPHPLGLPMSHQPDIIPEFSWGEMMSTWEASGGLKELPTVFWLTLGDDAMSPTAPRGTKVLFTRGQPPSFGDAVLLLGPDGALHVRLYGQSLQHGFVALPTNTSYAPFNGDMPGIEILATLSGIKAGWQQIAR